MNQLLVIEDSRLTFQREVNDWLSRGWKVQPGSLGCTLAGEAVGGPVERWFVVIEKD